MSFRLVPKSVTLNDLERRNGVIIWRYFSEFGYLPGALRKSSRSLSHLLMSSCSLTHSGRQPSLFWCQPMQYAIRTFICDGTLQPHRGRIQEYWDCSANQSSTDLGPCRIYCTIRYDALYYYITVSCARSVLEISIFKSPQTFRKWRRSCSRGNDVTPDQQRHGYGHHGDRSTGTMSRLIGQCVSLGVEQVAESRQSARHPLRQFTNRRSRLCHNCPTLRAQIPFVNRSVAIFLRQPQKLQIRSNLSFPVARSRHDLPIEMKFVS